MAILNRGAPMNIANGVREFARATPDADAVIDGDRKLSYSALHDRSSRVANVLLARGLQVGDRVAFMCGNRLEYPEVAAGVAKAGMVMVPISPRSTADEAAFIVGHSGARALIADDAAGDSASAAAEEGEILAARSRSAVPSREDPTNGLWRRAPHLIRASGSTRPSRS